MLKTGYLGLLLLLCFGASDAHTIDAVGNYRVEIGWMNEPVVSGETNALEFYVNPLILCPQIHEPAKCAASQKFDDGVPGLDKTVKVNLILKDQSITLPLAADHNIPGKYYAFVNPTVSGFYQANILGSIDDTSISLSMHPPKVAERSYIEFPEPSDLTLTQIIDGHTALIADINELKEAVDVIQDSEPLGVGYLGVGIGVAGIAIAMIALLRPKKA